MKTRPVDLPLMVRLELSLPPDSSWWAKSLRWSCGRPGYLLKIRAFEAVGDELFEEIARRYAAYLAVSQMPITPPAAFIRVTDV